MAGMGYNKDLQKLHVVVQLPEYASLESVQRLALSLQYAKERSYPVTNFSQDKLSHSFEARSHIETIRPDIKYIVMTEQETLLPFKN